MLQAMLIGNPAFTPATIANLALWFDAADTATITHVAGAVSQWNDKSGNARHATQATGANQPTTGTRTVNGRNVLDFDGTNDYLVTAAFTALTQPLTIFLVMKLDQTAATRGVGQTHVDGIVTTNRAVLYDTINPDLRAYAGVALVDGVPNTNLNCTVFKPNGASSSIWRNGGTPTTGNAGTHTLTGVTIGCRFEFTEFTDAVYCEYLAYDAALSNTEINAVGNYLANKWGHSWIGV